MHVQKNSNSKYKATIEKSYKQTHSLYASITSHLEAHVYVLLICKCDRCFPPSLFGSLATIYLVLKKMTSKDSHHKQ
jgi:hypothetical protein